MLHQFDTHKKLEEFWKEKYWRFDWDIQQGDN